MSTQDQINAAISAHAAWKTRLKSAIDSGSSEVSPSVVQQDNLCDFGKWLQGTAATENKSSPHYAKCVERHRHFHIVAARVLSFALSGKKDEALHSMGLQGDYTQASAALTKAMMDWKGAA
jgi:methyl-accepting chemotaxis protein